MELEEFKNRFKEIKNRGFVKTLRKGNTGIGFTFETLLSIEENNLALPDIENIELKTHRDNSKNLISLFTFNNKAWKMKPLEAIRTYGSKDSNGRLGLYYTMSTKINSAGLFLHIEKDDISVRHISGVVVVLWKLDELINKFKKKIPALLFISAEVDERDGIEYFHFYKAQLMKETTIDLLHEHFRKGNIFVDLRLHDQGTMARNHGTGFRIYEDKLPLLFKSIEVIE